MLKRAFSIVLFVSVLLIVGAACAQEPLQLRIVKQEGDVTTISVTNMSTRSIDCMGNVLDEGQPVVPLLWRKIDDIWLPIPAICATGNGPVELVPGATKFGRIYHRDLPKDVAYRLSVYYTAHAASKQPWKEAVWIDPFRIPKKPQPTDKGRARNPST